MRSPEEVLAQVLARVRALEEESHRVLGDHEAAPSRRFTLEQSYHRLDQLSLEQDELFRESLRAVEHELFRAAHVLAWAGFVDWLHERLVDERLAELNATRPKWNIAAAEDLREWPDFGVIEAGKASGAYNKTIMKGLHGLLNKRNECAHPSGYFPDRNDTLGYLAELFKRITQISG